MTNRKSFWVKLSLINLAVVASLGVLLRSTILFSLPFIDFKNLLSAHSHFAFGGWAGLALCTLLIYDLLPTEASNKKIYQFILWGMQISSFGMVFTFPFMGYALASIVFSTLYILINYCFAYVFLRDLYRSAKDKSIIWLSTTAVISLVISSVGPFGLAYQLSSHGASSISFRDFIYAFLHFQYNGFFTLAALSLFMNHFTQKRIPVPSEARPFSIFLCLSILPSLFLSLLWHNNSLFYWLSAVSCICILISLYYFIRIWRTANRNQLAGGNPARLLFNLSFISLGLKMLLQSGTIYPPLGNAVYGDRPLIIGYLHLVFLGFLTLFLLFSFIDSGYFNRKSRVVSFPFAVFTTGVVANEIILMLQGLGILLMTNSDVYNWLLLFTSFVLLTGALLISIAKSRDKIQEPRPKIQKNIK